MSHGCFISYKKEDKAKGYLKKVVDKLKELGITCSYLDETIESDNIDTVISILRQNYMNNKPVTIFLIGGNSFEDTKENWDKTYGHFVKHDEYNEQSYIIRELRATLSDYDGSPRHGVLGVVLPEMINRIYKGTYKCDHCGETIRYVHLDDDVVIREFWKNYYLLPENDECNHYNENGRYCVMCTLEEFLANPNKYIDKAYEKTKSKIAQSVHYKDIEHDYKLRDE